MKLSALKFAAVALVTAPMLLLTPSCAPQCVDQFDCADLAAVKGEAYTCEEGVCKAGNPSGPQPDAGETGGGGGETGGGGGATGGGGGSTGGGGGDDAGTGGGGTDDGGTGGGGGTDDGGTGGGTGGGGGATGGGGGGSTPLDPAGSYVATITQAQVVPPSGATETGAGTFTVAALGDGGYSLTWNITNTYGNGGNPRTGTIERGLGGRPPAAGGAGTLVTFADIASPISGTQPLSPADALLVAEGRTFVVLNRSNNVTRGQIIPAAHTLWTAQLNTAPTSATRGGAQFIGPNDGGDVRYLGAWTGDVAATMSHIHQGGAGGTGTPIVTLDLTPDAGGLAGSFTVASLAAGNTDGGLYVNVHTADAGNGLIRGQLVKH